MGRHFKAGTIFFNLALVISALFFSGTVCSQEAATEQSLSLTSKSQGRFEAKGDSSLHAFTIEVQDYVVKLKLPGAASENVMSALQEDASGSLEVVVQVQGMESGKKKMNSKMFEAMKTKQFTEIHFKAPEVHFESGVPADRLILKGELTIAGKTRPVTLVTAVKPIPDGLQVSGKHELLMTDYGIEPPTAMMGMLKTDNEVVVEFDWQLKTT